MSYASLLSLQMLAYIIMFKEYVSRESYQQTKLGQRIDMAMLDFGDQIAFERPDVRICVASTTHGTVTATFFGGIAHQIDVDERCEPGARVVPMYRFTRGRSAWRLERLSRDIQTMSTELVYQMTLQEPAVAVLEGAASAGSVIGVETVQPPVVTRLRQAASHLGALSLPMRQAGVRGIARGLGVPVEVLQRERHD